jgi:hypothetical protein
MFLHILLLLSGDVLTEVLDTPRETTLGVAGAVLLFMFVLCLFIFVPLVLCASKLRCKLSFRLRRFYEKQELHTYREHLDSPCLLVGPCCLLL